MFHFLILMQVYHGVSKHKMGDMYGDNSECFATYPCIRALLMLFNVIFWVSGLVLVWIGIWMRTDFEVYLKINTNYSEYSPYVMLAIGTIILFTSSLACSCIVKIQPTMLVIYGGFLITMLYTLISLSVYVYTYKDKLVAGVGSGLSREIKNYEPYSNTGNYISLLDKVQKELHCCGNNSYLDWEGSTLPKSCCLVSEVRNECSDESKTLFRVGCSPALYHLINTNFTTVGVTTSAIALVPLFGTVFAFALAIMGGNKGGYEQIA